MVIFGDMILMCVRCAYMLLIAMIFCSSVWKIQTKKSLSVLVFVACATMVWWRKGMPLEGKGVVRWADLCKFWGLRLTFWSIHETDFTSINALHRSWFANREMSKCVYTALQHSQTVTFSSLWRYFYTGGIWINDFDKKLSQWRW